MRRNSTSQKTGFTLVEVVVSTMLVGAVLGMIMGAVMMLDRVVANERVLQFPITAYSTWQNLYNKWGYWEANTNHSFVPTYTTAPSRSADAQAAALWRAVNEIYEQSSAVTMVPVYVLHDFSKAPSSFVGQSGYLSGKLTSGTYAPLTYTQLTNPGDTTTINNTSTLIGALHARFPSTFYYWGDSSHALPATVDTNSYRAATFFFISSTASLASSTGKTDRIIGILRMRAWQFNSSNNTAYRYYEVGLVRPQWSPSTYPNPATPFSTWALTVTNPQQPTSEDYSYRFMEDKKFPQNLILPPTNAQLDTITSSNTWPVDKNENLFAGFIAKGSMGARQQVSLIAIGGTPYLSAGADEWALILPDPAISQAEERARLRANGVTLTTAQQTFDKLIRRQGKYGCALSVYP